jgi:hypothetical protein
MLLPTNSQPASQNPQGLFIAASFVVVTYTTGDSQACQPVARQIDQRQLN